MSEAVVSAPSIVQMRPGAFYADHRSETQAALMRVVDSGWYVLGEEVRSFEEEFARYCGVTACVGVANGTDAIALALRGLGVGPGDRVATVSHTAVATVAAIEMAGASPIFVDITPDTYTLDPISLARTLGLVGPVKAIVAVHLYGHPADMAAINSIARGHGAFVVEDCSQAHGAMLNAQPAGSMGDVGTFSFYPTKNLGALGDGGMVATNNVELARRVRGLREYGWQRRYISELPGVNSRLDELQAAVLRMRLPHLDRDNARRRGIAAAYTTGLMDLGLMDLGLMDLGLVLPRAGVEACHVYHQYVVRHRQRDRIRKHLEEQGIGTNIHYPVPVHRQPAYASRCAMDPEGLEVTEAVSGEILSLPMYPELNDEEVTAVIGALRASF